MATGDTTSTAPRCCPCVVRERPARGRSTAECCATGFCATVPTAAFSAHFVEHLQPDACLAVMGHDFWRDPTHVRPYDPQLLAFSCAQAGLEVVETGANPRNHGGPPPGTSPRGVHVDPGLHEDIAAAVAALARGRRGRADADSPWHVVGQLLASLYPPNEVYVVARAR